MLKHRKSLYETNINTNHIPEPAEKRNASEQSSIAKTLAFIAICLGFFMVILDTTIANVALHNIQEQLKTTITDLQWIIDGYSLVFASFLLTAGALGDRLGSKGIFLIGLVLFTVASAACGIAPTLWTLEVARVVQGIGAALLVPPSLALLRHAFPDARERARAIGIWGAMGGVAAATGPVLGGFLVNMLSWRSVFLVNVPVGALGFLLTLRFVTPAPPLSGRNFDVTGQIAGIVALGSLTLACIQGSQWGWSSLPIISTFAIFVVATLAFLVTERHTIQPMLPLSLFARPTFSAANTVGLLLNFGFYGQFFFMPLFFQQIRGYSPLITGIALLPEAGVVLFGSFFSGRVTGRFGPRLPMVLGQAIGSIGFFATALIDATTSYAIISIMLVAMGFGISFTMPAMTTAVIEATPPERSGIGAAVLNASRQIGGVLGVAILGSLVGTGSSFVPGMHIALVIAGASYLIGCALSFFSVRHEHAPSEAQSMSV